MRPSVIDVPPERSGVDLAAGDPGAEAAPEFARPTRWQWSDVAVALAFLVAAWWVTRHGWGDINGRALGLWPGDQAFNEWMLAYTAHGLTHLQNPFFTTLQNAPAGVNLMSNVGLALPGAALAPVTILFGPALSYLLLITANLAGTAFAWYWLLSRHFVMHRIAAIVGGLFIGFAPGMISESNGHPHITAQWLVPFIIWRTLCLTEYRRAVRNGLLLGLLIAAQLLIGEEVLFITAVGLGLAVLCFAAFRPRHAWRVAPSFVGGLSVAAWLTMVICAYPLWMQFYGPQTRDGIPGASWYALRAGSFVAYAQDSVAGHPIDYALAPNTAEQSAFFGWPLLVLAGVAVALLVRDIRVRMVAFSGIALGLLSLGTDLSWGARPLAVHGPLAWFDGLPMIDTLIASRLALGTGVAIGVVLALGVDRLLALALPQKLANYAVQTIGALIVLGALLPAAPVPMTTSAWSPAVPRFVTSGDWRKYVADGHTLVPVPVDNLTSIEWGAAALDGFAVPQGYFLGPTSPTDHTGRWEVDPQPTAALLSAVYYGQHGVTVSAPERTQAIADARYWKADAFALPRNTPNGLAVAEVLTEFYGPARSVDDVWVWDTHRLR